MTSTREYPTDLLRRQRDAGLLVCHCRTPRPEPLALWNAQQCIRCGRQVLS